MSPPSGVSTTALITVWPVTGTITVVISHTPNINEARWVALYLAKRCAAPMANTMADHTLIVPSTITQASKIERSDAPFTMAKAIKGISVTKANGTSVTSVREVHTAWLLRAVTLSKSKRLASRSFAFKSYSNKIINSGNNTLTTKAKSKRPKKANSGLSVSLSYICPSRANIRIRCFHGNTSRSPTTAKARGEGGA